MRARQARVALALLACALVGATVAVWTPWKDDEDELSVEGLAAPFAAGNSAANMTLSGSDEWVLVRWVARESGTLTALHLRIQADGSRCRQSGRTGYGKGDGGSWRVTTHAVRPDGLPDTSATLSEHTFRPCDAHEPLIDLRQGVVRVPMRLTVRAGEERATVIRNTDPAPSENFTSTNFLYTERGILGANGRNERSAHAPDALYGLDPRELVGYSSDGGRSWMLPGGQYGEPGGRNFLPTYVQEYAGGRVAGQPYYYAAPPATGEKAMSFTPVRRPWVIRGLGAYTPTNGAGTLTLSVDGRERARAHVSGEGMLRAAIDPVAVKPGSSVRVSAVGLALQDVVADTAWGRLLGMHTDASPWRAENQDDFSRATPIYPLPAPPDG